MSRISAKAARGFARVVASSPAVAGFRPAGAALAVAAAFGLHPVVQAQPAGAQVIHGQAQFVRNGNNLTITTRNGAGTGYSAIDWQSFSVPRGSITRFNQPSASSTSINRVLGDNPSSIFGNLSSNGRLVLVNPAGIAVGAGAVVDTAGFTASTLGMSDADALAGRLTFAGPGAGLSVDGRIVARKGDVVLIAPNVATGAAAVIESQGATVLAAGQKVEITGRGLEGIHLEVQAPSNAAVNLGRLEGDAVAIFAGTLKHSGQIAANVVTGTGGKVVLKASGGDAIVSGDINVDSAKGKGGSIDVFGERVGLQAGAELTANGATGGGNVRIGGDYQGANASVPNAARTYMDADARIEADATGNGNGGRVIVWSDAFTRARGQISARGGDAGGNGGFAEVSGKQHLEYAGLADLRAPKGKTGTLLLDPNDVNIVQGPTGGSASGNASISGGQQFSYNGTDPATVTDGDLNEQLKYANVQVTTSSSVTGGSGAGGVITLEQPAIVQWFSGNTLSLQSDKGIVLNGTIDARQSSVSAAPGGMLHLAAASGDITQGSASSITVGGLYATATTGNVRLTEGVNNVGTIAGIAELGDFKYTGASSVAIGYVNTVFGGGSGINASGSSSDAVVDIKAAGGLTVSSGTSVYGGSVTLEATGSGADVTVNQSTVYGYNSLTIKAQNNLNVTSDSTSSAGIYGGDAVDLQALAG
ncbi:MAG: filamentous hemagglutinin N-terminal domain-containing protein, partial [Comamonadaceae bacterium]